MKIEIPRQVQAQGLQRRDLASGPRDTMGNLRYTPEQGGTPHANRSGTSAVAVFASDPREQPPYWGFAEQLDGSCGE